MSKHLCNLARKIGACHNIFHWKEVLWWTTVSQNYLKVLDCSTLGNEWQLDISNIHWLEVLFPEYLRIHCPVGRFWKDISISGEYPKDSGGYHGFWKMFMGSWVYQEAGKAGFSMTWTWGEEPRHWLRARKGWTDDGDRASPGTQSETKNKLNLAFFLEDCLNSEACSLSDWEMFKWEPVAPQWDQPVSWATRLVKTQRFKQRVKTHNDSNKG